MRVMCIHDNWQLDNDHPDIPHPQYGDIDIVTGVRMLFYESFYLLERFPKNIGYRQDLFIPLSDVDETEKFKEHLYELSNA
jgi:hypothetical protein